MTIREARLALSARRLEFYLARLELAKATKELERVLYRTDLPCHLRKQA